MVDDKQYSNDLSTRPDICFAEPSQEILGSGREDDVEDVNNDDIGEEINK